MPLDPSLLGVGYHVPVLVEEAGMLPDHNKMSAEGVIQTLLVVVDDDSWQEKAQVDPKHL